MSAQKRFVHLHVHTDFSLLDGANQIKPLAKRVAELGMPACAITDHGNLYGAVSFYQQMKAAGVKPIIGAEVYVAPGDRRERKAPGGGGKPYSHMILLAKDREGYHNLARLTSRAFTEGFYSKPRIDRELLAEFSGGLVGLSGCLSGVPQQHLLAGREEEAARAATEFEEILGRGNYFLEIQNHKLEDQRRIERGLVALSKRTGIPLVATNDAHYLTRDDHKAHEVMLCISTGKTMSDANRLRFGGPEFYVRSAEEMYEVFGEMPEAVERTLDIAEMCNVELPLGENHLPVYPLPADAGAATVDEYFERVVREGFRRRKAEVLDRMAAEGTLRHTPADYEARLAREIEMIRRMGFPSYFLIVWDFIKFAKDRRIAVGPGRGSCAGSLVAYCMSITDIDPLQYDLLFERFLNPERVSMPDIDVDFCVHGRAEVIRHVEQLYGRDSVCQIVTFGTMASKAAIKDVGRALDMPYAEVEKIAKLIPPPVRGRNVSISQALETVPELKQAFDTDPQVRNVIDIAKRLEGCARHTSVHAAGVVISPRPLEELVPVAVSSRQEFTTQYGMADLEKTGMLKMDFLGLTTLTIIDECLKSVRAVEGVEVDFSRVPLDDPATYALFAQGKTDAVFQFEGEGIREIARKLRPTCIEHLSALNALYRPGPLDGGMVEEYIGRFHGQRPVEYLVPEMEPILRTTLGVIIYQEQIMQLAQALAGYSLAEADLMRRAMGKKKPEEMAVHEEKFIGGAVERGIAREKAAQIFDLMKSFADYGFNLSHAVSYAYLSFQTAYLKAHYPEHFYAAVLTNQADDSDKVLKYAAELRAQGIRLLPPDVNESGAGFTPLAGGAIRYGLTAVKGLGEAAVAAVVAARGAGEPFSSFYDFIDRTLEQGSVNRRVVEALVAAGAFDSMTPEGADAHHWRARLTAAAERAMDTRARRRREADSSQVNMFSIFQEAGGEPAEEPLPEAAPWTHAELLRAEKAAVGFYVSGHPLDDYRERLDGLGVTPVVRAASHNPSTPLRLCGIVTEFAERTTKKEGKRFCIFKLEDLSGASVRCLMWPEAYGLAAGRVAADALVFLSGRVEQGEDGSVSVICLSAMTADEALRLAPAAPVPQDGGDAGLFREVVSAEADAPPEPEPDAPAHSGAVGVAIILPEQHDPEALRRSLLPVLRENVGDCEVFLDISYRDDHDGYRTRVRPKERLRVRPGGTLEAAIRAAGCDVEWLARLPEAAA